MFSGIKHLYPVKTKNAHGAIMSIKHFIGGGRSASSTQTTRARSRELLTSAKLFRKLLSPGEPRNNAVAERTNGDMLEGTRANLIRTGLPTSYCPMRGSALLRDGDYSFITPKGEPLEQDSRGGRIRRAA